MKTHNLKKHLAAGISLGALIITTHAATSVFIEGGSASSSVLYDRATNLFAGSTFTFHGSTRANVVEFVGNSTNAALLGYNPITLDINVANGAIAGLQALINHAGGPADTNYAGTILTPSFVDSATSPEAVEIDSVANNLADLPTYVVPLVFVKNANFPELASVTNLTQRQALALETSTNQIAFFGGTSSNLVYFVGRNSQAAVRTEIDYNIFNFGAIITYSNNAANLPVLDTSLDPGYSSASKVVSAVTAITNSIGTVAYQNATAPLVPIAYEGVTYSVTNVINGSYPLWGYEHYYYIPKGFTGYSGDGAKAVLDVFYNSVTNAQFQSLNNPVFTNNFVPISALKVTRNFDGAQITGLGNY